ncbi:MAG: hypothetical protein Kow0058_11890 [Roseovarius sp.]
MNSTPPWSRMRCTQPDRRTVSPTLDLLSSAQVWVRKACMSVLIWRGPARGGGSAAAGAAGAAWPRADTHAGASRVKGRIRDPPPAAPPRAAGAIAIAAPITRHCVSAGCAQFPEGLQAGAFRQECPAACGKAACDDGNLENRRPGTAARVGGVRHVAKGV